MNKTTLITVIALIATSLSFSQPTTEEAEIQEQILKLESELSTLRQRLSKIRRSTILQSVEISKDGTLKVDGIEITVDKLSHLVSGFRHDGVVVTIAAHKHAPVERVIEIMDLLRQSGGYKIRLHAYKTKANKTVLSTPRAAPSTR